MTMDAKKTDESGQALIELIIFLPLMFTLYTMISGFAGAINASINQQKVTRGYFYYRAQNSSSLPKPDPETNVNWNKFGMFFIGWREYVVSEDPMMPCFQVSRILPSSGESCEVYKSETSAFVRVGTVYGICGATYAKHPAGSVFFPLPDARDADFREVIDVKSCLIE